MLVRVSPNLSLEERETVTHALQELAPEARVCDTGTPIFQVVRHSDFDSHPDPIIPSVTPCALTGFLEITNGISLTAASNLPARLSFALILGTAAFGGLSGLAQTQSMIDGSGLSLGRYLKAKLLTALAAAACALALEPFLS